MAADEVLNKKPLPNPRNVLADVLREFMDPNARGVGVNTVLGFTESPASVKSLPMDAASRAARAQEMGYTIPAYKGSPATSGGPVRDWKGNVVAHEPEVPITSFQSPGSPYAGFFSDSPEVASRFAQTLTRENQAVFPVNLKMQNPVVIDAGGRPAGAYQFDMLAKQHGVLEEANRFRGAFAKGSPHDGAILQNTADEGTVYVPRASNQVRSTNANYDPKKAKSGDIMASILAAVLMGAGSQE